MLELSILGPLEVVADGRPVALGSPRQRATLAILLLDANRVVSVERIADELYAGRPPVTAVTQVQRQVSELRRLLGPGAPIETQRPGYRMRIGPDQLDLFRFERLTAEGAEALERGDPRRASELCTQALALWRGEALADLAREPFAQIAIARLDEMRLVALEIRIEADLACGHHRTLAAELDTLVRAHPYRETLHAHRMLALYRSGRQAEALEAFRNARDRLSGSLGLEPGERLRVLERAILEQDPGLELRPVGETRDAARAAVLAVSATDEAVDPVARLAAPLVGGSASELIVARVLAAESELPSAVAALHRMRAAVTSQLRTAAFTSEAPAEDILRLVGSHDVELVLLDVSGTDLEALAAAVVDLLERSPVDVALIARATESDGTGIAVPFAGGEHDWAALELGARAAASTGQPLSLIGQSADRTSGRRDASRLLADASLAVQRVVGIDAAPVLSGASTEALLEAAGRPAAVVMGMPDRWRTAGLGAVRLGLVRGSAAPTLLVHRGPRPGGLAPRGSATRFTWSIESDASSA